MMMKNVMAVLTLMFAGAVSAQTVVTLPAPDILGV